MINYTRALYAGLIVLVGIGFALAQNYPGRLPAFTMACNPNNVSLSQAVFCTVAQIKTMLGLPIAVTDPAFGAKCDGIANDTTAFNNAWSVTATAGGGLVVVPSGATCLGNFSLSGNNVVLAGAGLSSTTLKPFASGTLIAVSNSNFSRITGLNLNVGSFGAGAAIAEASTVNNLKVDHVDIGPFAFGVQCNGLVGTQTSGNDFTDSYILTNSNTTTALSYTYCNDFHIRDNQFGQVTGAVTFSGHGIQLSNSSAGQIKGNFVWQNTIGIELDAGSLENWVSENRITQNQQQGFIANGVSRLTFTGNQLYQNSNASVGAVESAKFVGVTAGSVISNNQFFDWTGTNHVNFHLTVDATSADIAITGNWFDQFVTTSRLSVSSSASDIQIVGNIPAATGINVSAAQVLTASTGNTTLAQNTTNFLGPQAATTVNGVNEFVVDRPGTVTFLNAASTTTPGAGQTYTYTIEKNGADSGMTCATTNTFFSCGPQTTPAVSVVQGDRISVKVVTSATAAAGFHRVSMSVVP